MDVRVIIAVAVGGAAGSLARYGVGHMVQGASPFFPIGTVVVNLVGCLLIGFCYIYLSGRVPDYVRLGLTVGVLGGMTTFSTFGLDAITLMEKDRYAAAALYVVGSVVAGLACVMLGVALGRRVI